MHLYTASTSPNGQRVDVFLKEKGIEIPTTEIDLRGAENLTAEFITKNPSGRVPVLETDAGIFLSESVAICRFIESLHPEPNLFGQSGEQQAAIEMWHRRVEFNLYLPVAQAFRNISGYFKDRETVSAEWGQISAETAKKAVAMFDEQLSDNGYIAGDTFSIADITLAITWTFAKNTRQELPQLANITSWHERITSRASFR